MPTLNKSSYVILGSLSKSDQSGYSLKRMISKVSDFYWSESNAQIYPVLKKLEEQQLVRSKIDITSGARNKRIFSITKKGLSELMKWLETDCELALYREEFLLQLSLSQHLKKAQLIKKIEYYRESIIGKLEKLNDILKHIKTQHEGKLDQRFLLLTFEHVKFVLEAKVKWCNQTLSSLS
jgi:PadR family transcriptional regulator AphA